MCPFAVVQDKYNPPISKVPLIICEGNSLRLNPSNRDLNCVFWMRNLMDNEDGIVKP